MTAAEPAAPSTMAALLEEQAAAKGESPYMFFDERVISFAELNRQVNRAANGLAALGVGSGVGVAIMMPNEPEWLYLYWGTQKLSAYAVPVNTGLVGESLRHVIDDSDAQVLVVHPDFADSVAAVAGDLPKVRTFVLDTTESPDAAVPEGWTTLAEVMDASDADPGVAIDPGAISAIMYTSGTTGAPKGVVQRYGTVNPDGLKAFGAFVQPDDVIYTCLPVFHANALWLTCTRALAVGAPVALSRKFSASRFWDEIRRYKVTTFNALGAMIPILMKQPERDSDRDNLVKTVFSAACPAEVWAAFEERFGVHIIEGYAATDGGGFATMNFGDGPKGSIGRSPAPFRIIDDDGADVPIGEPGELIFEVDDPERRKVEYYKNAEAGAARIRAGWFHTGDLVTQDAEGWLYFVDRKTDSMRRRGENISSWEVEREINAHPAVLESAVFGVPSELGEDDVMAVVVLKEGEELAPEDLLSFVEPRMAKFMVPRYIELRDELPKTETHRVQKGALKRDGVGPDTWDRERAGTGGKA
ncbi:MAG: AMP-binding protein [Acidimicrobiia bacterium]|nr:AMP-binding protein [Acidimicrobiia bacterium]